MGWAPAARDCVTRDEASGFVPMMRWMLSIQVRPARREVGILAGLGGGGDVGRMEDILSAWTLDPGIWMQLPRDAPPRCELSKRLYVPVRTEKRSL